MFAVNLSKEKQPLVFSLSAPFLALFSTGLIFYYLSHVAIPYFLILSLGLIVSFLFKKVGAIIASLGLLTWYFLASQPIDFWHVSLLFSFILTFCIASYSLEESRLLIKELSLNPDLEKNYQQKIEAINKKNEDEQDSYLVQIAKSKDDYKNLKEESELKDVQIGSLKNDLLTIDRQLVAKSEEVQNIKNGQEDLLDQLEGKKQEILFLRDQLLEMQQELTRATAQTPTILTQEVNKDKEQDLFNLQFRLDSALEDLKIKEEELAKKDRLYRKVDGLYRQLKEQFKAKADLLDTTRQELFKKEEESQVLQKEYEEKTAFNVSSEVESLMKHIAQLENEFELQSKQQREEIQSLEGLVKESILSIP